MRSNRITLPIYTHTVIRINEILSLSVRSQVQQHRCVQYYFSEDGHTQIERELQTLKYISHFWFEPQVFSATYTHRRLQHIRNFCGAIWWKGRALHKRFNWLESHTKASNQRRMLKKKIWKTGALSYYRKTVRHRKTQDCNSVHSVFRKRLYSTHTHKTQEKRESKRKGQSTHRKTYVSRMLAVSGRQSKLVPVHHIACLAECWFDFDTNNFPEKKSHDQLELHFASHSLILTLCVCVCVARCLSLFVNISSFELP